MAWMDPELEDFLTWEQGYTRSDIERIADRTGSLHDFVDRLNMDRRADGPLPSTLEYEAEAYHRRRRQEREEQEYREAEQAREEEEYRRLLWR